MIENRLIAAEQELMYRGVAGGDRIYDLFDGDARQEVKNMQQERLKYRAGDNASGMLDGIFAQKNEDAAVRLEKLMPVIRKMNVKFMLMAAPRFAELVEEFWGREGD